MSKKANNNYINRVIQILDLFKYWYPYQIIGLSNIPKNGGALVVINHGLLPFHALFLGKEIREKLGREPKGLGADFIFKIPLIKKFFWNVGAMPANNKNAGILLGQHELVLVAPGGILEGILTKPGRMHIPWEKRLGFVRAAAKHNAPIIPVYCDEVNDMYWQSDLAMAKRVRFNKNSRLPIPLFWGLGLIPLPTQLIIEVGKPIQPAGTRVEDILETHHQVLDEIYRLQQRCKDRRFKA